MKLIVHIGDGKTGTTSIQQTLEKAQADLGARGVHYLGRMLEFGQSEVVKDWQTLAGANMLLHEMADEDVEHDVTEVLRAELAVLADRDITTAIWSNEALFARNAGIIPALDTLRKDGVDVSVIVYLRRHDQWARSAYAQWGIRHKSYQGPIKPFEDWIAERPAQFAEKLQTWNGVFEHDLKALNFDTVSDVAQDFLSHAGVSDVASHRVYETPSPNELLVHAAFNDRFPGVVLPDKFERSQKQAGRARPCARDASRLKALLPRQEDLDKVVVASADDRQRVNEILAQKGQPVLDDSPVKKDLPQPDVWTLVTYLMKQNFDLHDRVTALEQHIVQLDR